jgi:cysteinyl-tRNA synthetase
MEKHLSHELDVNVEIYLGGLDLVVAHHLHDLKYRDAALKEILSIGVP